MKNKKYLISILSLVIILIISLTTLNLFNITGLAIEDINIYEHTKAICNETNFCQDYIIRCNGDNLLSKTPITRAYVQHDKDWKDIRENPDKLCY